MANSEGKKRPPGQVKTTQKRKRKPEYTKMNAAGVESMKGSDSTQEEKYMKLVQNLPCAVYSAYPGKAGPTTFMSNKWKDWTGDSPDELYQDPEAWPKCIHPDDREKAVNAYCGACKDVAPYNLEYRIIHKDTGQIRYVRDQGHLSKDEKGAVIKVDGIVEDITERKRVEERLRKSESRYKAVVENASEGIVIVQDRMLKFINPQLIATMGYSEKELMSRPFIEFIHPDHRERIMGIHLRRLKGEEVPETYEFRFIDKKGNSKWVENNGILIEWGGRPATLNFIRDITERKRMENLVGIERDLVVELGNTTGLQEGLRICLEAAMKVSGMDCGGIYLFDETSRTLELVYHEGLSPDFVKSISHYDADSTNMQLVIKGEPVYTEYEKLGVPLDGNEQREGLKAIAVVPMIDKGQVVGCMNVASHSHDVFPAWSRAALETVTAEIGSMIHQLKAEEAMRQSEERFRSFAENAPDFVMQIGHDRTIQFINRTLEGLSQEDVVGSSVFSWLPDDYIPMFKRTLSQVFETAQAQVIDHPAWNEQMEMRWYSSHLGPIVEGGNVASAIVVARDITNHKQAEEALAASETKYRNLFDNSIEGIGLSKGNRIISANKAILDIFGYDSLEEFVKIPLLDHMAPESREMVREFMTKREKGVLEPSSRFEHKIIRKDGQIRDLEISRAVVSIDGEDYTQSTFRDITEPKRAEETLQESEERFRSLSESSPMGVFHTDKEGRVLYTNKRWQEITGLALEESLGFGWSNALHPDEKKPLLEEWNRCLSEEKGYSGEFRFVSKSGEVKWVYTKTAPIRSETGQVIGHVGSNEDITERKRAEQALRESEERLKILFESAPDTIYLIDSEGRFVDGNRAAMELIGFTRDEVIGKSLAEIGLLSAGQLSKAKTNLKKVATGKLSGPIEYNLKRKDGSHISVEVRTFPVEIGGKMLALGIARDITKHKQTEKELLEHQAKLKSLASQLSLTEERERHRLATDLHDQISQSLVISKIKLDQLRKSSASDEFNRPLEDVSNCLRQIIDDTRTLTFDLSYPILYELGFEAAVSEWLADEIQEKHGIETEFENDGQLKPLDEDIRMLLFRDVRELLVNIVKHAQAHKVKVSVRRVDGHIHVSVEDDGVGFDPVEVTSTAAQKAKFGLFSIRERLEQLGGLIEIDSEPGHGSKITITAPLKNEGESGGV